MKLPFIRGIYNQLIQENLTRLILVLQSKATSKARDAIKEIFRFKVETFQVSFPMMITFSDNFFSSFVGVLIFVSFLKSALGHFGFFS